MIENRYLQLSENEINIDYGSSRNKELNPSSRYNDIVSNDTSYEPYHRNLIRCYIYIVFSVSLILIIVIFSYFRLIILNNDMQCINTDDIIHIHDKINYDKNNNNEKFIHKVILFGDSLIRSPTVNFNIDHNIYNKIILKYPNLNFQIISSGVDGNKIISLKKRLCRDVIYQQPEAVIMYWDSDISSPSIDILNSISYQNKYIANLIDVIITIKNNKNIKYFALVGPNIIGELPYGYNRKDQYLKLFHDINLNITKSYNITYIDKRKVFLNYDIEKDWNKSDGYLTVDGEHPSLLGSQIEEELFYQQLVIWYQDAKY